MIIEIAVSREQVMNGDVRGARKLLQELAASREAWHTRAGSVLVCFEGWDDDAREVFGIPEIRAFWAKLDAECPAWSYFALRGEPVYVSMLCLLPHLHVVGPGRVGAHAIVTPDWGALNALIERQLLAVQAAGTAIGAEPLALLAHAFHLGAAIRATLDSPQCAA